MKVRPFQVQAVAVCVPLRDEEGLLPALLDRLSAQLVDSAIDLTLCFLLDDCRDASAAIIARYAVTAPCRVRWRTVTGSEPNAGRARRLAMALGQAAIAGRTDAALLTTDADSMPAVDWIMSACRALVTCDVVAGIIVREPEPASPAQDRLDAYYERLYAMRRLIDPVAWETGPVHHHVGGANLAFRATAYAALGGFATLASGEDAAIVDAAHRQGFRVRRDRSTAVGTSGRMDGRATGGLATHLHMLARNDTPIAVGHPEDEVWRYRGHALARASFDLLHQPPVIDRLAAALNMEAGRVRRIAANVRNAEAFAMNIVPAPPGADRVIALAKAEAALMAIERLHFERAA